MLAPARAPLEPAVAEIARDCPELDATLLEPAEVRRVEPAVADGCGPAGSRRATRCGRSRPRAPSPGALLGRRPLPRGRDGVAVGDRRPRARRARRRGAATGRRRARGGRALDAGGDRHDRTWQPIVPVWGVVADVEMDDSAPARARGGRRGGGGRGRRGRRSPASIFSLVAADGQISVGSTFLPDAPEPAAWAGRLRRARRALRARLARAKVVGARACRARSRSTAARWWASCPASRASGRPRARAVGDLHRPGDRPRGRGRAAGPRGGPSGAVGRALLARPRPAAGPADDHGVGDLDDLVGGRSASLAWPRRASSLSAS